jgi:uncharacterized protein YndB with AHSA1/START domain
MIDAAITVKEGTDMTNAAATHQSDTDYQKVILFDAAPDVVFEALTTVAGLSAWWMPVSGSGVAGGELRFDSGFEEPLIVQVEQARRAESVTWSVLACSFLPDWVGTTPTFTLTPHGSTGCELRFRHYGLTPQVECYTMCKPGWDQALASLRKYVESGRGNPLQPRAAEAPAGQ